MYILPLILPLFISISTANLAEEKRAPTGPSVKIKNGTVVGSTNGLVQSFKGIPFAQPPVGPLRLKPPQPIKKSFGTFDATASPNACPQMGVGKIDLSGLGIPPAIADLVGQLFAPSNATNKEDCLTLNVQRPANIKAGSKLPVVFWIYGGGFETGSTNMYDATGIIARSIALGEPIVYVAVNYRLGGYGFLAGKELQKDGSTNLGLRDQRLGMEWVAENIEAFGGDPDKVVIWGESAGAISVFDHTIINNGNNKYKGKPLFRGAIMNSGSVVPTREVTSPKAENVYAAVVQAGGCAKAKNTLQCLRKLPFDKFDAAVNSVPSILSYRAIDLSYLPRPDPKDGFFSKSPEAATNIAKVPVIIGDQEDEGTLFSLFQSNITTEKQLIGYLKSYFPDAGPGVVKGAVATYPDSPPAGSPFRTSYANQLYPTYKRLAAILGDSAFTLARRGYLANVTQIVPAWSYLSSYLYGTPVLGTFHGSDVFELYYSLPLPGPPISILKYYISFFSHLDPNALGSNLKWPRWRSKTKKLMNFGAVNNKIITDDFRQKNYKYLLAHSSDLRI